MPFRSRSRRAPLSVVVALGLAPLAASCGGGDEGYVVETRDVYDLLRSPVQVARDEPAYAEVAILVDTADGRVRIPASEVTADGARVTDAVPEGPATWELVWASSAPEGEPPVRQYVDVVSRTLSMGGRYSSRPDVAGAATGTRVAIVAPEVEAWDLENDRVEVVSSLADVWVRTQSFPEDLAGQSGAPLDGTTSLGGWAIVLASMEEPHGHGPRLVDAALGDDLRVVHTRTEPLGLTDDPDDPWSRATVTRPIESFAATATYADGATTTLEGTFEPAPEVAVAFDFRASDFVDVWAAAGVPAEVTRSASLVVSFEPGEGPGYLFGVNPTLLDVYGARTVRDGGAVVAQPGDASLALSYGQPYGFVGRAIGTASVGLSMSRQDPVTGTQEPLSASCSVSDVADALASGPIVPAISPVRELRVGGEPAAWDAEVEGVGTTPTLSWEPPAVGAASFYEIQVTDSTDVGASRGRIVARVTTARTSFTFPEGILREGRYYFARVRAVDDERPLDRPTLLAGDRRAICDVVTGFFTP